jgi:hypothetical protein
LPAPTYSPPCARPRSLPLGPTCQRFVVCTLRCPAELRGLPSSPLPSFNYSPVRAARTHIEVVVPTSRPCAKLLPRPLLKLLPVPTSLPVSLSSSERPHPSRARPFSKLARASPLSTLPHPKSPRQASSVVPGRDPPPPNRALPPSALHPR